MRKSLGEKRKEISAVQIEKITRLYGDFKENGTVKILHNEQFGYQRITVERPLRLRYVVDEETLERLRASKSYAKLADADQERLEVAVATLSGVSTTDRKEMAAAFTPALAKFDKDSERAIFDAVTISDPDAPVIVKNGQPEPDPDLRDNENVPLPPVSASFEFEPSARLASTAYREAVDEHVATEVLPYVPDAWIDRAKTKIGYEIPFIRHFYRYEPPRPLAEIDAEIKRLEAEIHVLLQEITT
jgi:type I restriction enzyme M protein